MNTEKRVYQYGCSVYSLNGFPGDGQDVWSKQALGKLETEVKTLDDKRAYILSLNGNQSKARKILEANGFKIIVVTHTAHIDDDIVEQEAWRENYKAGKLNKDTIYLMGRGLFALKRKKRGA